MKKQNFEEKNEQIKAAFHALKREHPERLTTRLNLSWSNWGFGVVPGDGYVPTIWDEYRRILAAWAASPDLELMERYTFYERAKKAYAIVTTSEAARYANVILKKGIVS